MHFVQNDYVAQIREILKNYDTDVDVHLTNKEASTVLCSVVKHAGSSRARK